MDSTVRRRAVIGCALGLVLASSACGKDTLDEGTTQNSSLGDTTGDGDGDTAGDGDGDTAGDGDGDTAGDGDGDTAGDGDGDTAGDGDGDTAGDGDGDSGDGDGDSGDGDGDADCEPQPAAVECQPYPAPGPFVPSYALDDDDDPDEPDGPVFVPDADVPGSSQCDTFTQDCPEGEKCVPWASMGGGWDATKCVPVLGELEPGEPCVSQGIVEATDECEVGAYCLASDGPNGSCVELCGCSPDTPTCDTEGTTCSISNEGVIAWCLPVCDPVDSSSCGGSDICVNSAEDGNFVCIFSTQPDEEPGQPCAFLNDCPNGTMCLQGETVPDCQGDFCCGSFCDLGAPDCEPGTECTAFFQQGAAPECLDDVGLCISA
ncbi:hypothetical protein ENSA5_36300 [Enhygromyxa salina]|uniref:Endo-1,4-beta-xylanase A n=1 Tax=Enhygromyxa salina TaxID=215803 RepID=A0A2S9XUP4_9BACT|nr:hypothetical protein [Enhygromyxa salina]PRP96554.1 hypothetical protein ENSA5_36300 [Enhygromyxa salina]